MHWKSSVMKKQLLSISIPIILCLVAIQLSAQVGINTDNSNPDSSAMLDVKSATKGVLIPRMTSAERSNILDPATGLLVYQTNETAGFYYFTGTAWQYLPAAGSISAIQDSNGDTKVQTEKNPNEDKIRFDVDGNERMVLYDGRLHLSFPLSNTYIGDGAGSANTDGSENLFAGYYSGYSNSIGYFNTFIGAYSGFSNTGGFGNAFAGYSSGSTNSTGFANSFFGHYAGSSNGMGNFNSYFGENTGSSNEGSGNSLFGAEAGLSLTSGSNNILLGFRAGENLTNGSDNIIIGNDVHAPATNASNKLVIGATDLLSGDLANKRIGIGNPNPDASAILDVKSTTKGFLIPRLTVEQIGTLVNPADGLQVYNITDGKLYIYVSLANIWKEVSYGTGTISPFFCPSNITDTRDGRTYSTVPIGRQCWMAQNLNYGTRIDGSLNQTNNGISEKYCYDDDENNCNVYGGLYQWDEAMQYGTNPLLQGICPNGWHLPSDIDWCTLAWYLGSGEVLCTEIGPIGTGVGGKMKESGTVHWAPPNTGATNSSGFTALPGGSRLDSGIFASLTNFGYFWTSSQYDVARSWYWFLYYSHDSLYRQYHTLKTTGFSVRCLKD
jgi:uncharacterized protein (TIGR02145 family)